MSASALALQLEPVSVSALQLEPVSASASQLEPALVSASQLGPASGLVSVSVLGPYLYPSPNYFPESDPLRPQVPQLLPYLLPYPSRSQRWLQRR